MARTGRASVIVGKEFEIREYAVPEPEPGTLLLKQELSGICGTTDLHNWDRVAEGFQALHSGYRLDGTDAIKIAVKGGAR